MPSVTPMSLAAGTRLAHYEIVALIGEGGMGQVYRARDTKLQRDVALKVLPPETAADPERRQRFEREARAVAALSHPNIVTIHSVDDVNGRAFLTMELVSGQPLSELIGRGGLCDGQSHARALYLPHPIAFNQQLKNGQEDLWVVKRDGTGLRQLTNDAASDREPNLRRTAWRVRD